MKWFTAKLGVMKWIVTHRREIREMRKTVQKIRKVPDRQILWALDDEAELSASLGGGRRAQNLEKVLALAMRGYRRMFLPRAQVSCVRQAVVEPEK